MKTIDPSKGDAANSKFNITLPDNAQIMFENGEVYTFSTKYADYVEYGISGREEFVEYARYLAENFGFKGRVKGTNINNGTYTYNGNDTFTGVTNKFPVGLLTWNYDDFVYDWLGGTVEVYYTYQWALGGKITRSIVIPIANYEIDSLTQFYSTKYSNLKLSNLSSFDSTKMVKYDAKTGSLTLDVDKFMSRNGDAFDASEHKNEYYDFNFDLYSYIKAIDMVSGKYSNYVSSEGPQDGSSFKLDLSWGENDEGLANLKAALDEIWNATNDCWDYYKGIDTTVTAYIGGRTFVANEYFANYPEDTDLVKYKRYPETGEILGYYVYQTVTIPVKVASCRVESLAKTEIAVDPYQYTSLAVGAAIDSSLSANVRVGLETKSVRFNYDNTLASPKTLDYTDAVNGIITSVTAEQMSYLGYSGAITPRLNVLLGNRTMGYQSATVALNVRTMTAQATNVTIASDVFNPEWYNKSEYQSMTVSFAGNIKHTMYLDWSTYRLYSDNAYKNELVGDAKNIFAGGTFYATVEAYVASGNQAYAQRCSALCFGYLLLQRFDRR